MGVCVLTAGAAATDLGQRAREYYLRVVRDYAGQRRPISAGANVDASIQRMAVRQAMGPSQKNRPRLLKAPALPASEAPHHATASIATCPGSRAAEPSRAQGTARLAAFKGMRPVGAAAGAASAGAWLRPRDAGFGTLENLRTSPIVARFHSCSAVGMTSSFGKGRSFSPSRG